MKVLAFILSILVATGLLLGAVFLIVTQPETQRLTGIHLLALTAVSVFIYGPLLLGSMASYWDVKKSPGARKYFRYWFWSILGLELLGAVAMVVYAVVIGAPAWMPVLFVGGGAALTAVALLVGTFLMRREEARSPQAEGWAPIGKAEIRRKFVIIVVTFVAVLLIGLVVLGFVFRDVPRASMGVQLLLAAQFAFLTSGFVATLVTLPLNRRLRDSVSRDLGLLSKLNKVVLRRKNLELDPDERVAAVKYSILMSVLLPFHLTFLSLLYVGIGLQQVQQLVIGPGSPFAIGLIVALIAVLLVVFPLLIRRISRARRYEREHADELRSEAVPS